MAWPQTAIVTDEPVTTVALNSLPVMIANSTLSGDAASINFTSIPGHYAHLLVEIYARSAGGAGSDVARIRFNGDTGINYDSQSFQGSAATVSAVESFAASYISGGNIPGNTAGANLFGGVVFEVEHYANAVNNKAVGASTSHKSGTATGNLSVQKQGGFWRSSAAINQVTISALSGDLRSGSRVTLYGLP